MTVVGIDLSASAKRASVYALLDENAELLHLEQFFTLDELISRLEEHQPTQVAIDAPLTLPLGLDCLEEDHPCAPTLDRKGRSAEQGLAQMRIGCFFTTKRSIIKGLIYRGQEVYKELSGRGYKVIEVYPYATKVILFGDKMPPKNSSRGLAFLKDRLSTIVTGLESHMDDLNHDRCDAILSAYTAQLHSIDRTDALGLPEEGHIMVPKPPIKVSQ